MESGSRRFSKERLDNYRKNNHCPVNDDIATETGLWLGQEIFLGSRKDMEDIAEAIARVHQASDQLVGRI